MGSSAAGPASRWPRKNLFQSPSTVFLALRACALEARTGTPYMHFATLRADPGTAGVPDGQRDRSARHPWPPASSSVNWHEYAVRFRELASRAGRPELYVNLCLTYARKLNASGLPIIFDAAHLAGLVGYDLFYVMACCYAQDRMYRRFAIPKKAGGQREITEPLPSLKEIQRWLVDHLLYRVPVSRFAKGFVPGRGIKENARFHQRQEIVLSLDIKDFFPSISRRQVNRLFLSLGYSRSVSATLAYLCTFEDALPQGAPTSPALSNIVCGHLDRRIAGYVLRMGARYTRYADDITISGTFGVGPTIRFVRRVLDECGFMLNEAKTRVMRQNRRQEVTGIVVNERMRAPREVRREIRQVLHYINRYGLGSHLAQLGESRGRYLEHLLGKASFVLELDPLDRDANALRGLLLVFVREGREENVDN